MATCASFASELGLTSSLASSPEDSGWVACAAGTSAGRLDVVKASDLARLTDEAFSKEREKMVGTCSRCHSTESAKGELPRNDETHVVTLASGSGQVLQSALFRTCRRTQCKYD